MIIKASQRAGGKALAVHLMREDENDHVEVHEVRGFVGEDVESAFREAYAISNPLNFSREEWQQAKRINRDPRTIKAIFQDCWAISDSAKAFVQAMEARGYYIARGDRRAFTAIDHTGEVYAIARWTGVRTKEVNARLGDPATYPSVDEVKARLAREVGAKLKHFAAEAKSEFDQARLGLQAQKTKLVAWQRHERRLLNEVLAVRRIEEARVHYERFSKGLLRSLWDRITGRHAAIRRQNEEELAASLLRDAAERQALAERQLAERRALHRQINEHERRLEAELISLQERPARRVEGSVSPEHDLSARRPQRSRKLSLEA